MKTIEQLYKRVGVRKIGDFVQVKSFQLDTFQLPRNCTLISFIDNGVFPSGTYPFFKNAGKVKVYTSDELKKPFVEVKRNSTKVSSLITKQKRENSDFDYVYDKKKLLLTSVNTLTVFNYNALDILYRYPSRKGMDYARTLNKFRTVASCINSGISTDRTRIVHIPMKLDIPPLKIFKKAIGKSEKTLETYFHSDFSRLLFEFYKLLQPEYRKDSVWNMVHPDESSNIYMLFTYGNSGTMISLLHLLSAVKEYQEITSMRKMSGKSIAKLLLLFVIKSIREKPVPVDKIGESGDIKDNIIVAGKTDTGDIEYSDKDIENILDKEIVETLELQEHDELIEAAIDKVSIKVKEVEEKDDPVSVAKESLSEMLASGDITEKKYKEHLELIEKEALKPVDNDIKSFTISKEESKIEDKKAVLDKSMLEDTISVFDKKYIQEQMDKDIQNVIYSLTNSGHAVVDHKQEVDDTVMGKQIRHEITIQPITGRKQTIKFITPKVEEDGTFKISGNTYIMRKQKMDKPIRKISFNIVSLSSYYGKLFITRGKLKNKDAGYKIYKELFKRSSEDNPNVKMLVYSENKFMDIDLPSQYTLVGRYLKSFVFKNHYVTFDYRNRKNILPAGYKLSDVEKNGNVLIGYRSKYPMVITKENELILINGKQTKSLGKLLDFLEIDANDLPIEYASIKIMKHELPVVFLLMYSYGLMGLLKKLNVEYRLLDIFKRADLAEDEYRIKFSDKQLILKRGNKKEELVFGGLLAIKELEMVELESLDNLEGFTNLAYAIGLTGRYITEFKMMNSMFIDPITKDVLKMMKEPTVFKQLVLRGVELLTTDYFRHPNTIDEMLIKGYDRMGGIIYKTLVTQLKAYENKKGSLGNKIDVKPFEILNKLNDDSTVMLLEDNNPIAMLKQFEDVTMTGQFGRSKETLVGGAREFHESDVGIFSESVKDSSDVGISAYLTASPTIGNVRGIVDTKDVNELNITNILGTTSLLTPANDRDD